MEFVRFQVGSTWGVETWCRLPPMFLQILEKNPVNQGGFRPSTTKDQDMAGLRLGDWVIPLAGKSRNRNMRMSSKESRNCVPCST